MFCKKEIWMQEMTSKLNAKKKMSTDFKKEKSIQEAIPENHHHQKRIVCKRSHIYKIQSCSGKQGKPLHVQIVASWGQGGSPAAQGWHLVTATSICSQLQPSKRLPPDTGCHPQLEWERLGLYLWLNIWIKKMHMYQISSNAFLSLPELKNKQTKNPNMKKTRKICYFMIYNLCKICLNLQYQR